MAKIASLVILTLSFRDARVCRKTSVAFPLSQAVLTFPCILLTWKSSPVIRFKTTEIPHEREGNFFSWICTTVLMQSCVRVPESERGMVLFALLQEHV